MVAKDENAKTSKVRAIVVIPAQNEADRIGRCLAALAVQRDEAGAPIEADAFQVLVLANNCVDGTAAAVRAVALQIPQTIHLVEHSFTPSHATAGWARKTAMDHAAPKLDPDGLILTTDADSFVRPDWFAQTMRAFKEGADCVAGYIDADPLDYIDLGAAFVTRGRLEDRYLRLVAEIYALCDPRSHDPWPNHRVASGASLAVRLAAYQAVGGLPPLPLGEDLAFVDLLERCGFKVRHAMDVAVTTSCRLEGRAKGGAADTMRLRRDLPEAECDADLEPALVTLRRAMARGQLRQAWLDLPLRAQFLARWKMSAAVAQSIMGMPAFEDGWLRLSQEASALQRRQPLRPAELPRQIAIARMAIANLRAFTSRAARADRHRHELSCETALAPAPV